MQIRDKLQLTNLSPMMGKDYKNLILLHIHAIHLTVIESIEKKSLPSLPFSNN